LLQRYKEVRELDSEVAALRYMIDGLEGWLARRRTAEHHITQATDVATDVAMDEESRGAASLGDFGGMPSVGLPGIPGDDPQE
jgi:hypothetical protein